jgi:hypothetical protein
MKPPRAFRSIFSPSTRFVAAIGVALVCTSPLAGQETWHLPQSGASVATAQDADWTAATMGPGGSWGVAIAATAGAALAKAIASCKLMAKGQMGCGAQARTTQAGWIVGLRCGGWKVIAVGALLTHAEQAARSREDELRRLYTPDLPPCRRILAVGPGGEVATTMSYAGGGS